MIERLRSAKGSAFLLAFVVVFCGSGCAYRGHDDALSQRFTWFSYMNGDDIRAACVPGAPPRYRFVYNAVYIKQARAYDIVAGPSGDTFELKARVLGPSDLSSVTIDDPIATLTQDPLSILAPFAGARTDSILTAADELARRLAQSGFSQPAPKGLYLRSEDFFWIAVACVDGRITFNAWKYPSARFEALTFPQLLFGWDTTGVPINPPRPLTPFDIYGESTHQDRYPHFTLTVGKNGLAGTGTLF